VQLPADDRDAVSTPDAAATSPTQQPATSGASTPRPSKGAAAKKGKKGKGTKTAKPEPVDVVALRVELPRPVRKALRKRASDYGWTAEEAAAHVLRVWADDRR
jgi:hypothetical protein